VEQQPTAGQLVEHLVALFALAEHVQERRERAHVHAELSVAQQVRDDPVDFADDYPQVLGAFRHLDTRRLFDREHQAELHVERAQVVHAVDVGQALHIGQVLEDLLAAAMQVADQRLAAEHHFAVRA
jgi:hypothetical protein